MLKDFQVCFKTNFGKIWPLLTIEAVDKVIKNKRKFWRQSFS